MFIYYSECKPIGILCLSVAVGYTISELAVLNGSTASIVIGVIGELGVTSLGSVRAIKSMHNNWN